jgi:hypothetical protein
VNAGSPNDEPPGEMSMQRNIIAGNARNETKIAQKENAEIVRMVVQNAGE